MTDRRERWRVAHPLPEVLLLAVRGTIAACDDYEDIENSLHWVLDVVFKDDLSRLRAGHGVPVAGSPAKSAIACTPPA